MKRSLLLASYLVFLLLLPDLHAQRSSDWKQSNDRKNRYEGTYTRKVRNSAINLVSLIAQQEAYTFGQKQSLKVRFYSPQATQYQLKAEEKQVRSFYWMEDKNTQTQSGWNLFEGWPVDYLLRRLSIQSRNLGILLRLGKPGSRDFVPAYVYHSALQKNPTRYTATFHLGQSASRGTFTLYRGKGRNQADSLFERPISRKAGGNSFPIIIETHLLPTTGWYTLDVSLREKGTLDPFGYSFHFYHER